MSLKKALAQIIYPTAPKNEFSQLSAEQDVFILTPDDGLIQLDAHSKFDGQLVLITIDDDKETSFYAESAEA